MAPSAPGREGVESGRRPRGLLALWLAAAALVCCWNALAAPFGLGLGAAGLIAGARALRRGAPRRRALAALAASGLALAGSAASLAFSAGSMAVVRDEPVVQGRTQAETDAALRELAGRTAAARSRARDELSRVEGQPAPAKAPRDSSRRGR